MKKSILTVFSSAIILFTACNSAHQSAGTAEAKDTTTTPVLQAAEVYTCEMDPEVLSDKPGKCPKCGMNLIRKEAATNDSTAAGTGSDAGHDHAH